MIVFAAYLCDYRFNIKSTAFGRQKNKRGNFTWGKIPKNPENWRRQKLQTQNIKKGLARSRQTRRLGRLIFAPFLWRRAVPRGDPLNRAREKGTRPLRRRCLKQQRSKATARRGGGRRRPRGSRFSLRLADKRNKGVNDGKEPQSPSTYLLMYLQNMKNKKKKNSQVSKHKVQSVNTQRKRFYSKDAVKQSQTAQLQKKQTK